MSKSVLFKVADKKEIKEALKLISERYFTAGYLNRAQSKKPYYDKYVKHSIYFVAKHDNKIVGVIRVVKNSEIGLPATNEFELYDYFEKRLNLIDREKIVEIGNLATIPGHKISRGLYKEVIKYCLSNKYLAIACIDQSLYNYLAKKYWMLNPFYRKIGQAKYHIGSTSVPVEIRPRALMLMFL